MFCPKCGKGDQQPNAYCRACGDWLPDLAKRGRKSFGGDSPEESLRVSLILSAMSAVVALVLAVLLYATYLGREGVSGLIYVTAAFLLVIATWQASNFYVSLRLQRNLKRRRTGSFVAQSNELNAVPQQQNAVLPAADTSEIIRPAASVTENTTEFLEPVAPRRRSNS